MAYNITLTNGNNLVTIEDGTADTSYSSLTLFGKNYAGYGPLLDQNLVHSLENFSLPTPPRSPLQGQLWWDSANRLMKVFKSTGWKVISGPTASTIEPVSDTVGDLWWDSVNQQLSAYNGSDWKLVGPVFSTSQGVSGPVTIDIPDNFNVPHTVVYHYVAGVVVAVSSKDQTFTTSNIPGWPVTTIKLGYNLIGTAQYHGDANNALSLGGVLAGNFLRSDVESTTNFGLSVLNNDGVIIGANQDLHIGVAGSAVKISSDIASRNLEFYVSLDGLSTLGLRIDGVTGLASVAGNPTLPLGVATKQYVDNTVSVGSTTWLRTDGSNPMAGNLVPVSSGTYTIGSNANRFNTVYANSFNGTSLTMSTAEFATLSVQNAPTLSISATNKLYVDTQISNVANTTANLVSSSISSLINGAPAGLDTLAELASALGNNVNYSTTVSNQMANLAPISNASLTDTSILNATLTGIAVAPTVGLADNSTRIATTAFVNSVTSQVYSNAVLTNTTISNITLNGTTIAPTVALGDNSTTIATTAFVNSSMLSFANLISNSPTTTFAGNVAAQRFIANVGIETTSNLVAHIGSLSNRFGTVYADTFNGMNAYVQSADLAEYYIADAVYEPGTVLDFGGEHEVCQSVTDMSTSVAGVVSTKPGYLMNQACVGEFVAALALQGRVPCRVTGTINKGDCLVSAGNGRARAEKSPAPGTMIGKSLNYFEGEEGIIEIAVGRF